MPLPPESPAEHQRWRPRDAALALGAGLLLSLVALVAIGPDPTTYGLFGVVVPAQAVGTLVAIGLLARRRGPAREALRARIVWADGWGLLVGAGLQVGLSLIAYWVIVGLFGADPPSQEVVDAAAEAVSVGEWALVGIGLVALAPLSEELVFRGILLGSLQRHRSDRTALLWSAAAFALLHLLDPNAWLAVPFLFVVGIVTGRRVLSTGRLGGAVMIHAGFNLVTVLALVAS